MVTLKETLEEVKRTAEGLAERFQSSYDTWPPVAFFFSETGNTGMVDIRWESDEDKAALLAQELPEMVRSSGASSVVVAFAGNLADGGKSGEKLSVIAVDVNGSLAAVASITRHPLPKLGRWQTLENVSSPWISSIRSGLKSGDVR